MANKIIIGAAIVVSVAYAFSYIMNVCGRSYWEVIAWYIVAITFIVKYIAWTEAAKTNNKINNHHETDSN